MRGDGRVRVEGGGLDGVAVDQVRGLGGARGEFRELVRGVLGDSLLAGCAGGFMAGSFSGAAELVGVVDEGFGGGGGGVGV